MPPNAAQFLKLYKIALQITLHYPAILHRSTLKQRNRSSGNQRPNILIKINKFAIVNAL